MRVAVIGAGVSGLSAAYVLSRAHEVTLFEREARLGGHAHTHEIQIGACRWPVDTGFMVFNHRTYPNFVRLLAQLEVETRDSDMSFSVRCRRCELEFSSRGLRGLLTQPLARLQTPHLAMLGNLLRFYRHGRRALNDGSADTLTLGEFLDAGGHNGAVARHFVLPMGGAIWSASGRDMRSFPASTFLRFLENHGLLQPGGQPIWKTIVGGSTSYVSAIARHLGDRARVSSGVVRVSRHDRGADVTTADGSTVPFDRIVIATHADEALALLADPSEAERDALGRFRYSTNDTWLHSDDSLLPATPVSRASWNCDMADCQDETPAVSVTYDLGRLQGIARGHAVLCSLNPLSPVKGEPFAHMTYTHPILDGRAIQGQKEIARLNGERNTFFCGAHLRYGFHEDGLMSALWVTRAFGLDL